VDGWRFKEVTKYEKGPGAAARVGPMVGKSRFQIQKRRRGQGRTPKTL